jgi:hypothetical protein
MRLEAPDAARPDDRIMPGHRWQLQPISHVEIDGSPKIRQPEANRTRGAREDLVIGVVVGGVAVGWPV